MKMKKITVLSGDWKREIEIDSSIFDDIYAEACTRIVEEMGKSKTIKLGPVMLCWEKDSEGQHMMTYNSYKILINAGYHKLAEYLRKNLYRQTSIDWALEPIKNGN